MEGFFERHGFWFLQGFGILFASGGVHSWIKFLRCAKFPATTGAVERAAVERRYSPGDADSSGGYSYYPCMTYSYAVEGESFRSEKVYSIGERGYLTSKGAEKVLNRFPVGDAISVRYDPENPASSFLINGTRMMIVMFLGFGLAVFGLGFWLQHKQASPPPRHLHHSS